MNHSETPTKGAEKAVDATASRAATALPPRVRKLAKRVKADARKARRAEAIDYNA